MSCKGMAKCGPSSSLVYRPSSGYSIVKASSGASVAVKSRTTPQQSSWHFGEISQLETEQLLLRPGLADGTFLVRNSASKPGCSTLCVKNGGLVHRYRVEKKDGGVCVDKKRVFKTMEEMISFYMDVNSQLCCRLSNVCPSKDKYPVNLKPTVREISRSAIQLTHKLIATGSEEVWCGVWTYHVHLKMPVHVRKLSPRLHSKADILQETEIMHKLCHDKVVQLYGVSTEKEPIYVVSESLANGSLLYFLREGTGQSISFRQKVDLAVQVACGMDYLQSRLCINRYLCAKNVFLNEKNVAKIANFRYAKMLLGESCVLKLPVEQFHIRWSSPEVLKSGIFSLKSDVWSFGILLTEISTNGKLPYSHIATNEELKEQIVTKHCQIPQSHLNACPAALYEIMKSCWRYEANKRPKFDFVITALYDCVPFGKGLYAVH